ncbi:tetratricopeptide repeat protein [Gemmata sp. G18]|uniref:Tetratricopeptide repeat protein n=1 Tax=Gemmata palustris TaxID=2822762 RepID=A0ABS5C262_9BACT|nr:tetratricopeptide repeat protein [Gemmata palustris]MBP3960067.1 tetratricopeptide repeat protein [Gemmata palustris]
MRERLNIRVSVLFLAAVLVSVAGVALLQRWQVRRNAPGLLELADSAEAKGRRDRALWLLASYLERTPGDTAARARYGLLAESLARDEKTLAAVAEVFERVLAEAPDRADVRLRLARIYTNEKRFPEAAPHLAVLNAGAAPDAEAVYLQGVCQEVQGKTEAAEQSYQRAIELDPHVVPRYAQLALLLRRRTERVKDAANIIERMVEANPLNETAYLTRAKYLHEFGKKDEIRNCDELVARNLDKAVALAPKNGDVRFTAAAVAVVANKHAQARGHLRTAIDHNPGDERLYLALAVVEAKDGNRTEAAEVLRRAATRLPGNPEVLFAQADMALQAGNLSEAERVLTEIGRWKHAPERAVVLRGRLQMAGGDWRAARATLEAGRPALTTAPRDLAAEADVLLGRCHERLGEGDLALVAYRRARILAPDRTDAPTGEARTLISLNRLGEAADLYGRLADAPTAPAEVRLMFTRLRVLEYLSIPPADRRPRDLEPTFAQAAERSPNSTELLLLRAEVLSADRKPDEAEALLRKALAAPPGSAGAGPRADIALPLARLLYQHGKAAGAWAEIDTLDRLAGPSIDSALTRLELLPPPPSERPDPTVPVAVQVGVRVAIRALAQGTFQLAAQVAKPTDRMDDRCRLATGLAEAHTRWRDLSGAQRWWREVVTLRPADLSARFQLFELAVQADDRGQMEKIVREINQAVGGQDSAFGHYAEALLRIARPRDQSPESIREARQHLNAATRLRPSWAALSTSRAILAELEKNPTEALAEYLRAVGLGERRPPIVLRAVQLLCADRRYAEADALLRKLRTGADPFAPINKLAAEVSLFNRQPEEAVQLAIGVVAPDSKQYEEHLWQAEIMDRAGRRDEAVGALRRAIEVSGPHGAPWVALVKLHVRTGKRDKAEEVLAEAREHLKDSGEQVLTLAQCNEALGRMEEAGKGYASAAARPGDAAAIGKLFEFHSRSGTLAKAVPVLRNVLAGSAPALTATDAAAVRRALAIALAAINDPATFQEALGLIEQNLALAPENPDDLLAKARVLGTRAHHRREALNVLLRLGTGRAPGPDELFFLAQLYADTGAWVDARRVFGSLLAREGDNPTYLRSFVDRLLRNGATDDAEVWLAQLQRVAPDDLATVRLQARVLVKRGEFRAAAAALSRAARPRTAQPIGSAPPEAELPRLSAAARAADELGAEPGAGDALFPVAETLYRDAAKRGAAADALALVGFVARRGRVEEAIKLGREVEEKVGSAGVATALVTAAYGYCPVPLSDSQLDAIEAEVKACLGRAKPSPASAELTGLMHARRGRYAEAAREFRTVVAANEKNAPAINNVAYMLILAGSRNEEVGALLEKAWAVDGPTAGLLDSRGMLHLDSGRTTEAVTDLEQAVEQNATAAKCLHLATAYHRAGKPPAVVARALERSESLQTDGSLVLPAEQKKYRELAQELKPKH